MSTHPATKAEFQAHLKAHRTGACAAASVPTYLGERGQPESRAVCPTCRATLGFATHNVEAGRLTSESYEIQE